MKIVREIARILVGITFIFSGFVKGIDPLGSTYKFTDYFNAFHWEWATIFSFSLAVLQALLELGIGVALLLNYRTKLAAWLALGFMVIFLPLTLYIALENPVTDCGCFGDALILSNWETFYKNIIITLLAVWVVIERKKFKNRIPHFLQNIYFIGVLAIYGAIAVYSYRHLPIFDFRPYKVGNNINDGMTYPDDAQEAIYKSTYYYKNLKNEKIKKFTEKNHPWQDTLHWEYVEHKTKLIKKGYIPPMQDFTIETPEGDNIADFFLHEENHTFIMVAYNLSKSKTKEMANIQSIADWAMENDMYFICLTSSSQDEVDQFMSENEYNFDVFFADEVALKTVIRSNPGLLLTHKGDILNKWHWRDIPSTEKLESLIDE